MTCPVCGDGQLHEKADMTHVIRAGRRSYTVPNLKHWVCSNCETSICSPSQLNENAAAISQYEDKIPSYISPEKIVALREKYGITQAEAGKIFGGGPRAFSKYERGLVCPNASSAANLKRALNDPKFFASLAEHQNATASESAEPEHAISPSGKDSAIPITQELETNIERYAADQGVDLQSAVEILLTTALASFASKADVMASALNRHVDSLYINSRMPTPVTHSLESSIWGNYHLHHLERPERVGVRKFVEGAGSRAHQTRTTVPPMRARTAQRNPRQEEIKYAT